MDTQESKSCTFRELAVGQTFDWNDDSRLWYYFYRPCMKISTRRYKDDSGQVYQIGSVRATVYHVGAFDERFSL